MTSLPLTLWLSRRLVSRFASVVLRYSKVLVAPCNETASPETGGIAKRVALQIRFRSTKPHFQPVIDRLAEPSCFRRFLCDDGKGMDITERVKRNNSALAQYDAETRCAAQKCLFSDKTLSSPAKRHWMKTAPDRFSNRSGAAQSANHCKIESPAAAYRREWAIRPEQLHGQAFRALTADGSRVYFRDCSSHIAGYYPYRDP